MIAVIAIENGETVLTGNQNISKQSAKSQISTTKLTDRRN
jgi:uncharacterized protein YegP (UPF0339 family)